MEIRSDNLKPANLTEEGQEIITQLFSLLRPPSIEIPSEWPMASDLKVKP